MEGDRVFAISLVLRPSLSGTEGYGAGIHALVVRPCSGENTYCRIGIFWTSLLYLGRKYNHILDGNDVFVKALVQHVTWGELSVATQSPGESTVMKPFVKRYIRRSDEVGESEYRLAADQTSLCLHSLKTARERQNWLHSQEYLEFLKESLAEEKSRVQE
jgi:hypothetical protein